MNFKLRMDTENAAFQHGNEAFETARILRGLADSIDDGSLSAVGTYVLRDINGNQVGKAVLRS